MDWLNYHHLLYFWTVAREGGISRAAERLRLSQPTISAQIRLLEESLGQRLLQRQGRTLVMTDVGRVVCRYADEIFGIGRELLETIEGRPTGRPWRFAVGISDSLPKLTAHRLLEPALALPEPLRLVLRVGKTVPSRRRSSRSSPTAVPVTRIQSGTDSCRGGCAPDGRTSATGRPINS